MQEFTAQAKKQNKIALEDRRILVKTNETVGAGLTGPMAEAAVLSDGGIISGVNVKGGSAPFVVFCSIKYMAKENCSRVSLPVC